MRKHFIPTLLAVLVVALAVQPAADQFTMQQTLFPQGGLSPTPEPSELPAEAGPLAPLVLPCRSQVPSYTPTPSGTLPVQATLWTTCGDFGDAAGWSADPSYYKTVQFPDVDGDGRADVCGRFVNGIWCARAAEGPTPHTFGPARLWSTAFNDDDGWADDPSYWATIRFPDVNNDGKADVCGRWIDGLYCGVSNGVDAFNGVRLWIDNFSDAFGWKANPAYWATIKFVDLDNDGYADVCGRGYDGVLCARNLGWTFGALRVWSSAYSDANGWNSNPSYWGTLHFANLNFAFGLPSTSVDLYPDVCGRGIAGLWCGKNYIPHGVFAFTTSNWVTGSNVFSDARAWGEHTNPAYWSTIQFGDINDDGTDDVCGRGPTGMLCFVAQWSSNGVVFRYDVRNPFRHEISAFNDSNGWAVEKYYATSRVVDVDGDGRADVCGRGDAGINCAFSRSAVGGFPDFEPTQIVVANFGDNDGWGSSEAYWGTVQPADVEVTPGAEWCGRGSAGIYCSEPISHPLPNTPSNPGGSGNPGGVVGGSSGSSSGSGNAGSGSSDSHTHSTGFCNPFDANDTDSEGFRRLCHKHVVNGVLVKSIYHDRWDGHRDMDHDHSH